MNITVPPTQPDQLDVTRTGERTWSVHEHGSHPVGDSLRTYDNQAAAWHHAVWTPLHAADALPNLAESRQLFAEQGSPRNMTADPRRAARVPSGEYDETTAKHVTDLITAFIQSRINDPAHMAIYGEEPPMTDESTENPCAEVESNGLADYGPEGGRALAEKAAQDAQNDTPEAPAADDGATTQPDPREAVREALSDSDRNAYDNFSHMADKAPSEQARDFWQAKADEVAANAA